MRRNMKIKKMDPSWFHYLVQMTERCLLPIPGKLLVLRTGERLGDGWRALET